MNILYYDCFSGISGDMNLAAMIQLGIDPDDLRRELSTLGLDHEFRLTATRDSRNGIVGTRVDVALTHPDRQEHRSLRDIEAIIENSRLDEPVRITAVRIFRRLAEAEAKVHGTDIQKIHFHEVGAVDAIVDIVGAAICYHSLKVDQVWSSPVELGGGFVRCAHGTLPVPAPATVEILTGIPTTRGAVRQETTTPTGAAILATLVDRFTDSPLMSGEKTAYGIGHRDSHLPNVLRVQLARAKAGSSCWTVESARLLQCNIDDMTPEMLGVIMNLLLEKGAQDVHFTSILMKKNRPAVSVSVLCPAADEDRFKKLLFEHTSTLGIKSYPLEKTILETAFEKLDTPLGPVTMKHAMMDGKMIRSKPELEDCKALAQRHGISLGEVYYQIGKSRK